MGRARLKMELIKKEKARHIAFKKRNEGLMRKMHEFTTLCDVNACMIVYGPKQENAPVEPEIWPQNPDKIREMIDVYKEKKQDSGHKTFGLNDFFLERKKRIEDELSKLRTKNREAKYPTELTDEMQKEWSEGQLRQFADELGNRSEYIKSRIEMLKSKQLGVVENNNNFVQFGNPRLNGQFYPPPPRHPSFPIHYPNTVDHHHPHPINQNSMMNLLMNGGDEFGGGSSSGSNFAPYRSQVFYETGGQCGEFGGGSSSGGNFAPYRSQVFYETGGQGVVDPMTMTRNYGPPPLGCMVAPQELHPTVWNNYGNYEDALQYHMKNDSEQT